MQQRDRTNTSREPPLWLVVLMFPLSLGVIAAALAFLYHALVAHNPPGTTVVNPAFSLLMLVAGGVGFCAGCAAVFRRVVPASPAPSPGPPPTPKPVEVRPALAWQTTLLSWFFWLLGAQLQLWLISLFLIGWGAW